VEDIDIDGPMIRLGQLLKLSGLVDAGGDVRPVVSAGLVAVDGVVELASPAKLHHGDVVALRGRRIRVRAPAA
jgi:ribosome-associated protein